MSKPKRLQLGMKYITRINREDGGGTWWVRLFFGANFDDGRYVTPRVQKSFPDSKYNDSSNKSLAAAKKWRDEQFIGSGKQEYEAYGTNRYKTKANGASGVVGVYLVSDIRSDRGPRYYAVAGWSETQEDGSRKQKKKQFVYDPADEQDMERALRKAKRLRNKMVKIHYVGPRKFGA